MVLNPYKSPVREDSGTGPPAWPRLRWGRVAPYGREPSRRRPAHPRPGPGHRHRPGNGNRGL